MLSQKNSVPVGVKLGESQNNLQGVKDQLASFGQGWTGLIQVKIAMPYFRFGLGLIMESEQSGACQRLVVLFHDNMLVSGINIFMRNSLRLCLLSRVYHPFAEMIYLFLGFQSQLRCCCCYQHFLLEFLKLATAFFRTLSKHTCYKCHRFQIYKLLSLYCWLVSFIKQITRRVSLQLWML